MDTKLKFLGVLLLTFIISGCLDSGSSSGSDPVSSTNTNPIGSTDSTNNHKEVNPPLAHYTKIDSAGQALLDTATPWSCILDTDTGLMWEVKTTDGGLHDNRHTYTWYSSDSSINKGDPGILDKGFCSGSRCDTEGFVEAVNKQGLCGYHDWRMPTKNELQSIIVCPGEDKADFSYCPDEYYEPAIDLNAFPNTTISFFWTGTSPRITKATYVRFRDGGSGQIFSSSKYKIRLVRKEY